MKSFSKILAIVLLVLTTKAFAYIHPCPGGWGINGEFLYLKPSLDDTYFVIDASDPGDTDPPKGERKDNDFDFEPGFRIEVAYTFCDPCNLELHLDYSYLSAWTTRTVTGDFLYATTGFPDEVIEDDDFPGEACSTNKLRWHNATAFVQNQIWSCCPFDLYFRAGLQYYNTRFHQFICYTDDTDDEEVEVNIRLKSWGIGPQVGLHFEYNLCQLDCLCGQFSFIGLSTGTLFVSKVNSRLTQFNVTDDELDGDVNNEDKWRLVPAWHTRLGFNYTGCCSCFAFALEVGYDFYTYHKAFSRVLLPDDTQTGYSFDQTQNFDLHGPYVALGFTF